MLTRACFAVVSVLWIVLLAHCGSGGETATGGTPGTGGTAGTAGTGGSGGEPIRTCLRSPEAVTFCSNAPGKYGDVCKFGGPDRFVNQADCENTYDAHKESNRTCVEQHLGFADAGDPNEHCPHATGLAICTNTGAASPEAVSYCDDYEARCGFGGADRHPSEGYCEGAFDSFDDTRQRCVEQHVGFALSDPGTHCPHAMGQAPCNEVCATTPEAIAFCEDYEDTCGFGGQDRHVDQQQCENTYNALPAVNQDCVEQHLGFAAAGDKETHCPHAMGRDICAVN